MRRYPWQIALVLLVLSIGCTNAGGYLPPSAPVLNQVNAKPDEWFKSDEGQRVVDNIVSWQNPSGGWWKTYDPKVPRPQVLPPSNPAAGPPGDNETEWRRTSTFDNDATTREMRILARAQGVTGKQSYQRAFSRGLQFIFESQYPTGGWPQRFPLENNYGRHITFNDGLMTNVMNLLKDVAKGDGDYTFVAKADRAKAQQAFERGLECILNCQIKANGKLTAWCQQHDAKTLEPVGGRAYELPSISGSESSDVVLLLMDVQNPSRRVRDAVESATAWYEASKILGKRYEKLAGPQYEFGKDRILMDDPSAQPLWARFYEIDTNRPFFCNRDGIKVYALEQVAPERRAGYAWYGNWGSKVLGAYPKWKNRAAAQTAFPTIVIEANGTGGFRTVQEAVDSIPAGNSERRVIVIKPGVYKERITVPKDKPMLTFKGEDASKTVLTYDLHANLTLPGTTQPVGTSGTPSVTIDADDFIAENITFENSAGEKGQAVALKTTGDRSVFRNCRMLGWQDTLYADKGRQYFVNCYIEGRVDFIFGGATAVFDRCTIHSKNGGYVTAARTPPEQKFGFVFLDCTLTGEGAPAHLGRPWQWDRGRKASVAFIRTKMGPHILPQGWDRWDRPNNPNTRPEQSARYFEYGSTDAGDRPSDVSKRVAWAHQLTPDEAAAYTVENVLGGDDRWESLSSFQREPQ